MRTSGHPDGPDRTEYIGASRTTSMLRGMEPTQVADGRAPEALRAAIDRLRDSTDVARWLDASEEAGRLAAPLLKALHDAKLFRLLLPTWLDGFQLDPPEFVRIMEALGALDASVAWCIGQASGCSMAAAHLAPEIATEIFAPRDALLAWGTTTTSRAVAVDGGYRMSGSWRYASGIHHATWLGADCRVVRDDGSPVLRPDGTP